jgi:hypothetical protein
LKPQALDAAGEIAVMTNQGIPPLEDAGMRIPRVL